MPTEFVLSDAVRWLERGYDAWEYQESDPKDDGLINYAYWPSNEDFKEYLELRHTGMATSAPGIWVGQMFTLKSDELDRSECVRMDLRRKATETEVQTYLETGREPILGD
jgi:hypothetical protein